MKFKLELALDMESLLEYVEIQVARIQRRGGTVIDVDFLTDDSKSYRYRAVIKYVGGRQ